LLKRRWRLASAAATAVVIGSIIAGTALAEQQYRVQEGDTITAVGARFGVEPVAIIEATGIETPDYLYPGQLLTIPGTADSTAGTGLIIGTYEVAYSDTINSIAHHLHVDAAALLAVNGMEAVDVIYPGQVLVIPETLATRDETLDALDALSSEEITGESEADSALTAAESAAEADLPLEASIWVPTHVQQRSLSCEFASAFIATSAFGNGIDESTFWSQVPVTSNPHYGYRGNIDGDWGNYEDYGIYPEALVPVLNANGFSGDVFYGDYDPTELMQQLARERPVIVWLAMWGDTGLVFDDEGTYTVFAGEHVMTAYGYDQGGVYLSDPASGSTRYYDWGTFLWMWGASDGMSLAVYPL
jgi:uncharacterized protein YvpB